MARGMLCWGKFVVPFWPNISLKAISKAKILMIQYPEFEHGIYRKDINLLLKKKEKEEMDS